MVISTIVLVFGYSKEETSVPAAEKPNFLFILTDDEEYMYLRQMPNIRERLIESGTNFARAYVADPQCCPSRASYWTGKYVHNHGILNNDGENYGWQGFHNSGQENDTLAVWLDRAGYYTGYAGKYFNTYARLGNPTTYVPPGYDQWFGRVGGRFSTAPSTYGRYQYNSGGEIKTYRIQDTYDTYLLANRANQFIRNRAASGIPWFFVVSTSAPHVPNYPPPEFRTAYDEKEMPKAPSFNEADISDKPKAVQELPLLDEAGVAQQEEYYRARQEDMLGVDVAVGRMLDTLAATGQLDNTYVIFSSDNGYGLYRNRIYGKGSPYEHSIRVPFVVRGPGVGVNKTRNELVSGIDLAPTLADLAGLPYPDSVDGRSFAPLLPADAKPEWRKRLLVEFPLANNDGAWGASSFTMLLGNGGVRYVERATTGEKEYYDLSTDPYQLENSYDSLSATRKADLAAKLEALRRCAGGQDSTSCRLAEDASGVPETLMRSLIH